MPRVAAASGLSRAETALALWQGQRARARALAREALDIALAAQARDMAVFAGLRLGDAQRALGRVAETRRAYAQAHGGALEIGDARQHDASAGLARVALAEAATATALATLQPLRDQVAAGSTLDGTNARHLELTCHQTVARAGDPAAADWLARAHTAPMGSGRRYHPPQPRSHLAPGLPEPHSAHREIVAAWDRHVAGDEAASGSG